MIFIQSVKKYNINIKTYMQVVLSHYTSISSKTKLLDKKRSIISVASIIYISPILQCLNGALNLTETTHLDILSVLDEMEV
jgi:hypothetical protein